jgi:beta-phosphoglucomutase
MQQPRAVLWDLDGTIVDSQRFHWIAWKQTLEPRGVRVSFEQFLRTFGQTNATFLPAWLGPDARAGQIREVSELKEACFRRIIQETGLSPLPGVASWIARLDSEGWRQAIASSAPRLHVEAMLNAVQLRRFFAAIVAAEDVRYGKPDPQVFLEAAARLEVTPARTIVVEDAVAGIEGVRRAGMLSVGVNGTIRLEADLFARSLEEIPHDAFTRLLNGWAGNVASRIQTTRGREPERGC